MPKLFDSRYFADYLAHGSREVDGYLQSGSAALIWSICDIQDELGIAGNIAEIGVYHGKLFILLCHALNEGERAFAIDLFDSQPAIQGIRTAEDRARFSADNLRRNLAQNGIGEEVALIITANSRDLGPGDIKRALAGQPVRLFSVDGDHSRAGARHDLNLAAAALGAGGVIIVDDLFNTLCPSATEGIIDFFRDDNGGEKTLAPIAIAAANGPITTGAAKLFVAGREYAERYKAYLSLLNRGDFKHADEFLGFENVLIFDFQATPSKHPLDDAVRRAVAEHLQKA